jgi:hypothetical protein
MQHLPIVVGFLGVLVTLCAYYWGMPPRPAPAPALDPDRTVAFHRPGTSLEGSWRLLAVEGRSNGRAISRPFGAHPIGHLVYMPNGRMSVMLMAGDRARFGTHGIGAGSGREKAAAFDSFLAYTGRYERLENRVIHHPDVASIPDFVGVPEERFVLLEGDRLTLSTPPMLEKGQIRTFAVIWQKVVSDSRVRAGRIAPAINRAAA